MRFSIFKFNLFIFYICTICFVSYFLATRDLTIGTDALTYQSYFLKLDSYSFGDRTFELGYHYFNYIIFQLGGSYSIFLFTFFLVFNLLYIKCLDNFFIKKNNIFYFLGVIFFLGIILLSSWYQSATLNGLRQGFSLILLYLSLSYLFLGHRYKFLFYLILSCFFHDSTLLILPFLLFFLLNLKSVIYIFILVSIFYPLGLNEILIGNLSNIIDLPLHDTISSYSENNEVWKGFQLNFYTYSVFWCLFFIFLHYKYYRNSDSSIFILKILLILTIFYFVFGFGSFSNRFGFVAWLFLPIIQTFYSVSLSFIYFKRLYPMLIISFSLLAVGLLNYYFILRPMI